MANVDVSVGMWMHSKLPTYTPMVCKKEAQLTANWIIRILGCILIHHTASHLGVSVAYVVSFHLISFCGLICDYIFHFHRLRLDFSITTAI